jgi:lactate dehydrogenase-like 2-hydroxyacid dehydrogenase
MEERTLTKPKLVVTSHFTEPVEDRIYREYEPLRGADGDPLKELLALTSGADAMLVTPNDRLDAEFFNHVSPTVKVIATYSVGLDHIDLHGAAAKGIAIAYTPGANADATADIAMLLMLGASRRAYEGQELLRSQKWASTHTIYLGWQMTHKVLGIVCMGQVGQAVACRARAFGMEIHYTNPRKLEAEVVGDAVFHEKLSDLLAVSEFLSLNAPETAQTHHLLNRDSLAQLPPRAIVVNTARGGLVDDEALIAALASGHIAAAGLDVFEGEPNVNPSYLALKNTFLLPHFGSATVETRTHMGMLCLDNIEAVLAGRPAPSLVKSEVL